MELLGKRLGPALQVFDFIVIDSPPGKGVLQDLPVLPADIILIPTEMGARASEAVEDYLVRVVQDMKGEDFNDWHILLTKVDKRNRQMVSAVEADLNEAWPGKVLDIQIPVSEELNQAQYTGQDIFSYRPESRGAQAYRRLRDFVINHGR